MSEFLFERVVLGCLVLGTIERRGRRWAARATDWREIGVYTTRHDAFDAIWVAHIVEPAVALFNAETPSLRLH